VNRTSGILHDAVPESWRSHRFGLPAARWESLAGKVFWVIGAGTGYGRCIATCLALAEAAVFLTGRRADRLESTKHEAVALGASETACRVLPADTTKASELEQASARIAASAMRLDGLVCCAALPQAGPSHPLATLEEASWRRLIETNVTGQWLAARAALPLLARNPSFRILFLTSEAGWAATAGFGPYNVSKAALNSLSMSLAEECAARFAGLDVQVNALDPGEAHTEMNQESPHSPYFVVSMALALLSHPAGGPNGRFFHRDGRHLAFAYAREWDRPLIAPVAKTSPRDGRLTWAARLGRLARGKQRM
jgi:NAD(P)-dependent dehydrogenase (short-subunit alcohol dehydrogenase family)